MCFFFAERDFIALSTSSKYYLVWLVSTDVSMTYFDLDAQLLYSKRSWNVLVSKLL